MTNHGVEIDLSGVVFQNSKVSVSLMGNITLIKNRIDQLHETLAVEGQSERQYIDGIRIYKEGESVYNLYLRNFAGVNKDNGESLWYIEQATIDKQYATIDDGDDTDAAKQAKKDAFDATLFEINGKKATNAYSNADRYATGNIYPAAYGGFGASVEAYGFDLSFQFSYQMGGRVFDYTYQDLMHVASGNDIGINWHKDILNAWTPENPNSNIPRLNANDQYANGASDRFLVSSNYLSLQNITLGYTLPKNLTKQLQIASVRIYGSADNLKLWSARQGFDPRQGFTISEGNYYSPMMTVSGGVKITF
jgi:hypothetical protein